MTSKERDERRAELLSAFRESSMTQKAFCREHGLPLSTLQYWLNRERKRSRTIGETQLVPVGPIESAVAPPVLRVVTDSGVSIEIERPVRESELVTVLRAIAAS